MTKNTINTFVPILVIAALLLFIPVAVSASPEICNYADDDGDGLCFGGSNDGSVCTVPGDCPGGSCITVDEDFNYQGIAVGNTCDGIGECGIGFVQCIDDSTADCSSNPGGLDDGSQDEICDYLDNDCDGFVDNGFDYQGIAVGNTCDGIGECGIGFVQCIDDSTADCSSNPGGIDDQSTAEVCNGLDDDCNSVVDNGGNALCSSYSLAEVATCSNDPDANPFTWDWFPAFDSVCQGASGCTTYAGSGGSVNWTEDMTHTCNLTCGAECVDDGDCSGDMTCSGCVCVLEGDVNNDCVVSVLDLAYVGIAYGSHSGDVYWNGMADLDDSGSIDIIDLAMVAMNFRNAC